MFYIYNKEICNRHGNGICCNCVVPNNIICRNKIKDILLTQQAIIEDMKDYIFQERNFKFNTIEEVEKYFYEEYEANG